MKIPNTPFSYDDCGVTYIVNKITEDSEFFGLADYVAFSFCGARVLLFEANELESILEEIRSNSPEEPIMINIAIGGENYTE